MASSVEHDSTLLSFCTAHSVWLIDELTVRLDGS